MKKTARFIALAAIFIIPLFALFPTPNTPFDVSNNLFFPFITGKAFYFRILVEIALACWVILAFMDARYRPKLNALTISVTVFALVTLFADLLGLNPIRSFWSNFERMEGWITVVHLWALFIVAVNLFGSGEEGKKSWLRWFNISLIVALIVGIYGLAQLFGWAVIHQGSSRIDSSLGNAAYMAVYMLFAAGLSAYMFFAYREKYRNTRDGSRLPQWIYAVMTCFFSFLLVETGTRGTTLGLVGGIILALFLYAVFAKNGSKKSRWISGSLIIFIILFGFVFWLNRGTPFIKNSEVLNRLASISISDTTTQARGYIWPMALKGAFESSKTTMIGLGQENFNYIFNKDYNPHMWSAEQWFDRAHNVYLDWLVAGGLIGLLAYLALYILIFRGIWKSDLSMAQKSVLSGLIAGYAVHNIFVFDNLASYVMFFVLLGFVGSFDKAAMNESGRQFDPEMIEYVIAPISIVALVMSVYFFNIRLVQANTRLIEALRSCYGQSPDASLFDKALAVNAYAANQEIREQILQCTGQAVSSTRVPGPVKQALLQAARNAIQTQIALAPKDARMYVLGGQLLNQLGQFADARPLLEKAHELTPAKQTVDLELATNYINSNKNNQALDLLKQAYEEDPSYGQAKQSYAIGLVINDREDEARKIFKSDPEIFETEHMAQAYTSSRQYAKAAALYQKLSDKDPSSVQLKANLAQAQYQSGMKWQAVQTLKALEKDHPEYKEQIEAAIKQAQQ